MSVAIRAMRASDVPAVAAIARASMPEAWTEAGFASELEKPACVARVLEDGARVVAFVIGSVVVDTLEVASVAVAPEARRAGVGRALVGALLREARARGATEARLDVRAGNVAAIALYAAQGFVEVGRRRAYYADGEDAVLMTLRASAPAT